MESKVFPKLQKMGGEGQFYTQNEVKAIVSYARDRGIRVVPEFDIPGHTTALLAGYPELASAPGPYAVKHTWGVHDATLDPTNEKVYAFLDTFFGEVSKLFPDHYVHIGGDEVNGKQWSASPRIQAFMTARRFANNDALQAYFNRRVIEILRRHGKAMIGWDEIIAPGMPATTVAQSWRGKDSLATSVGAGYFAILSKGYYLDNALSAAEMYANDPTAGPIASLPSADQARVLGGEACMWTEHVTPKTLNRRVWPRAAAVAERLWSPASVTDAGDLARRLSRWSPIRTAPQTPFHGTPSAIPGVIESEDYDNGGEGVSYHDTDGVDTGQGYREDEAVDVEPFGDGRRFDVGYTRPGQWLKYTVTVAAAGAYDLNVRVSSGEAGGVFHVEDGSGANLTGPMTAPATGGWDTWTLVHASVHLQAGRSVLKFVEDTGGYNLDSMTFTHP